MMGGPSLRQLSAIFLRIGNLTFGGGDPTMAALQRELVERRKWLAMEHYGLAYALARITPGTNVLAFCVGAGWYLRGWPGAVVALLAACIPSAAFATWLVSTYQSASAHPWVAAAMTAVVASIVGVTVAGAWLILRSQMRSGDRFRAIVLVGAAFLLAQVAHWSPIPILGLIAVAGWLWKEPADA